MKTGIASGRLQWTEQQAEKLPKELLIMDGAVEIRKGNPVYTVTRRSTWSILVTKIAKTA